MILLALGLRLSLLGLDVRLHPDEALYASQARLISQHGDVLLLNADLDKPPLTLYATALSFELLGPTEFAARLPNVLFSGLTAAALYALARTLYSPGVALAAALLIALSPYDLAFAATAFTDVQATFWLVAAAWCAAADRPRAAGVALALALACKPTALVALPLVAGLGLARAPGALWRDSVQRLWRMTLPLIVGAALLGGWDLARTPRSFLALGWARNDPGGLATPAEWLPRLETWLGWLRWAVGSPALGAALLLATVAWIAYTARRRDRSAWADRALALGVALPLALYVLVAFRTYDRYLHPLIPFALLLAARALAGLLASFRTPRPLAAALALAILALLLPSTGAALRGDLPLGGDRGQHTGIDALAAFLDDELAGEIVYDHWLGWELAFYLGGSPRVLVLYAPDAASLAVDFLAQPYARYVAAPAPADARPWLATLSAAGVRAAPAYHDAMHGFVVYRLERTAPE